MRNKEATRLFQESDKLFREKKYAEALAILDQLDEHFPNWKNVLYPRALCLANLDRPGEAKQVAAYLVNVYKDPRAQKLLDALGQSEKKVEPLGGTSLDELSRDSFFDEDAGAVSPPPAPTDDPHAKATVPMARNKPAASADLMAMGADDLANLDIPDLDDSVIKKRDPNPLLQELEAKDEGGKRFLIIAIVVGLLAIAGVVTLAIVRGPSEAPTEVAQQPAPQQAPGVAQPETQPYGTGTQPYGTGETYGSGETYGTGETYGSGDAYGPGGLPIVFTGGIIAAFITVGIVVLITLPIPLYFTLLMTNNLVHGEFLRDYLSAWLVMLGVAAVSLIPCFGWIIAILIVKGVYHLDWIEVLIFLGLSFAFNFILGLVLQGILMAAGAPIGLVNLGV